MRGWVLCSREHINPTTCPLPINQQKTSLKYPRGWFISFPPSQITSIRCNCMQNLDKNLTNITTDFEKTVFEQKTIKSTKITVTHSELFNKKMITSQDEKILEAIHKKNISNPRKDILGITRKRIWDKYH